MNITRESGTERKADGRADRAAERRTALLLDLLLSVLLFAWTFFLNRKIRISGYYMDDLYMWSCWGEQSFLQYVFPVGSTRCRFVYWLAAWAELWLIGNHISWVVPVNLCLNALLAVFLYRFAKELSRSPFVAFLCGVCFLASRFAYYQVGQLLGLMETMGTFFALAMAFCLYRVLEENSRAGLDSSRREKSSHGKNSKSGKGTALENADAYWVSALAFYFLNCFTHERYMVLLPMFFYVLFLNRERKPMKWLSPLLTFAAVLLIRRLMIGSLSPAGTGGTKVSETFTVQGALVNFCVELLYLAGVNAGPEHLNGLPWSETPALWKLLVALSLLLWVVFFIMSLLDMAQRRRYRISLKDTLGEAVLFLGFLTGAAVSSAVTIRVEMRWIYVMLAFGLLLTATLFGERKQIRLLRDADPEAAERYRISDRFPAAVLTVWAAVTVITQCYYRGSWPKIYLFPNQARYNALADVTYGRYGTDILGKEIVIIGNSYEMSDFTAETFFKTFDPERTGQGTTVTHVESMLDFGQVTPGMIVLKEDPARDSFIDATDLVRSIKLESIYGYYQDGWMDENARIRIMTGESGDISMHVMYPGNLKGNEAFTVIRNTGYAYTFDLKTNESWFTFTAQPRQIVELEFSQNFYMESALEQRGGDRLSMLVEFRTD